ncbi:MULTISPECIES: thioredoxin family protein [unclassified Bosea (in: a-proteobacteria)]|uniref:thioredoxin family protein n=1 Tax=unclassified Bosea (in: a-proteobacteria) TaxID=2653178 RepID=UPI001F3FC161|nr:MULTISPECIES: thioredoxin family protein [unclassified Bosea (in: a-proteobacteria)]
MSGLLSLPVLSLPALAAELVMYTRNGCPFCVRFEREVAPVYAKTPEGKAAPLRRIELPAGGFRGERLLEPVIATPTFVLMEGGQEVGRITGYLNDDMFWGLLGRLVAVIEISDKVQRSGAQTQ